MDASCTCGAAISACSSNLRHEVLTPATGHELPASDSTRVGPGAGNCDGNCTACCMGSTRLACWGPGFIRVTLCGPILFNPANSCFIGGHAENMNARRDGEATSGVWLWHPAFCVDFAAEPTLSSPQTTSFFREEFPLYSLFFSPACPVRNLPFSDLCCTFDVHRICTRVEETGACSTGPYLEFNSFGTLLC